MTTEDPIALLTRLARETIELPARHLLSVKDQTHETTFSLDMQAEPTDADLHSLAKVTQCQFWPAGSSVRTSS